MKNNPNGRKAFYMVLSVFIAAIIWIFVDMTGSPDGTPRITTKEFNDIPIEYLAAETVLADRGLMLIEEGTDTTVDVTLKGTRWNLARVDRDDIIIQADLSAISVPGRQTVVNRPVLARNLSKVLEFTDVKPYTAAVNIGELYSKSVNVRYEIIGNVADGYFAGELAVSPTSFEIRGKQDVLDRVAYAKVSFNIGKDAQASVSERLEYQYYDKNHQLIVTEDVYSDVDHVEITLPVNVTKDLQLVMKFHESPGASLDNVDYKITPSKITVTGDAARLRNINSLTLADFELAVLNSSTIYNYIIPVPDGCENLSGYSQASLQLSFKDMYTADVLTNRIRYDNLLMEGKDVELLTTEMSVRIFGTSADVQKVTADDIMVVADLTDFNNAIGSYTVPAKILIDTTGDIGIEGTYQVRVNITEHSDEETTEPAEGEEPSAEGEIPPTE